MSASGFSAHRLQRAIWERAREAGVVIEIHEDAYKQNTVYCSWQDILANRREDQRREEPADTDRAVARTERPLPEPFAFVPFR